MNKNGFTLIELLAVIVVLSIILVIAVPRVMSVIENSRKESFRLTGEQIVKGVSDRSLLNLAYPQEEKTYVITDGVFVGDSIPMSGELPDDGRIHITSSGEVSAALSNGTYCVNKYEGNEKIIITATVDCELYIPEVVLDSCFTRTNDTTQVTITGYDSVLCSKNVIIPSVLDGLPVRIIGGTAFSNDQLTSVRIPTSVTSLGEWAFEENDLTNIVIPTSITSIGNWAFKNNQLVYAIIPAGITNIGHGVFNGNQLTSITIPTGVTSIRLWAFQNNKLTNVTFPSTLTIIEDWAFSGNFVTSVTIPADVNITSDAIYPTFYTAYVTNNARTAGTYTAPHQTGTWTKQ